MLLYSQGHLPRVIAADQTREICSFIFDVPAQAHGVEEGDGVCGVWGGILFVKDHVVGVERSGR